MARLVTVDTYSRMFQFKILNNILYLNDRLFLMSIVNCPLCSLCKTETETFDHFFVECNITISLWNSLQSHFSDTLNFDNISPQSAVLGFLDENDNDKIIKNHILLMFKFFLFKFRNKYPTFDFLISFIRNVEVIERKLIHVGQATYHNEKWDKILPFL